MTIRIAVIGTSHAAAFKSAWDEIADDWPDVSLTFFAARNQARVSITSLVPRDGKLVAGHPQLAETLRTTSGGLDEIDPGLYDAILLVGFPPRPVPLPPHSPYSDAVRAAMYDFARTETTLAKISASIRAVAADLPSFVAAQAFAATPPKGATPGTEAYMAAAEAMQREVYSPLGHVFLPQPGATLLDCRWTDPAYSRGSVRLATGPNGAQTEPHPAADRSHMNTAYGALALAEALPVIAAALATG